MMDVSAPGTGVEGNGKKAVSTTTYSTDVIAKAPFSHDAGSGTGRTPPTSVPDHGSTMALLSGAMAVIGALRHRLASR
jgi:hypothetical protein